MFGRLGLLELPLILIAPMLLLIVVWPAARISRRLGFSPLLGALAVVPIANLVLLWFVAFADWPLSEARRVA